LIDSRHPVSTPGKLDRVPARSAADVEDRLTRLHTQLVDDEVDLSVRALREYVVEVFMGFLLEELVPLRGAHAVPPVSMVDLPGWNCYPYGNKNENK
jgi:hypothetical protein